MPPKIPPLPPESLDAIELAAADWLVLKDHGLTAAQELDFARWLALDPRHADVFRALESTWSMLGEHRVAPPRELRNRKVERLDPTPLVRMEGPPPRGPRTTRRSSLQTSGLGLRRGPFRWSTSLAAAAAIAVGLFAWQRFAPREPAAPFHSVATTEIGALRQLDLPDGSIVRLNTDSAVEIAYTAAERRVKLARGEAHFSVAKNPHRPFIVSASGVDVRAVGTAFNVRLRPESVDVLVTEGKVNVAALHASPPVAAAASTAADTFLIAGQRTSFPLVPAAAPVPVATLPEAGIKQALAWQERRLDFDSATLAEMVAEINRYNHHKLIIADARLELRRFGGSFPAGDYETFVRLLENNFGVIAERRDHETLLRLPQ